LRKRGKKREQWGNPWKGDIPGRRDDQSLGKKKGTENIKGEGEP